MTIEYLKIPKNRIAALIGSKGATKKEIEEKTGTKIEIDSKEGEVNIISRGSGSQVHTAEQIVTAIARGFSPEHAMRLIADDYFLEIINLEEVVGKSEKAMKTKRARVIGRQGTTRTSIEKETGCLISVYGKTISIIGTQEELDRARHAVVMLLEGAGHRTVEQYLKKSENTLERFEL